MDALTMSRRHYPDHVSSEALDPHASLDDECSCSVAGVHMAWILTAA